MNVKSVLENQPGGEVRPVRSNVVWRRISERIEQRLAVIERGIAALLSGSLTASDSAYCRAEASLLSDWLFALDQVVAGRLARDLVDHFDGAPSIQNAATIAAVVDRLRTIVRLAEDEWGSVEPSDVRVHIVSGANAQIDAVAWHLQQSGIDISYSPTFFSTPDDVDLVVLMSEHPDDAQQMLNIIHQRSSSVIRALVLSADVKADALLRVAPSADLFLRYDADPLDTANQIMIALRPPQDAWSHAVLYGANELYGELKQVGFRGLIAQDASTVIDLIEAGSRVVVLGPEAERRAELVHLLRRSPTTRSALIAVTYRDAAEQERCSRAGANLTIPEIGDRGSWALQLHALSNAHDHESGVISTDNAPLLSGPRAWVLLERALGEVERGRGKAALATISLSGELTSAQISHVHGLLAEEFRRDDTVVATGLNTVAVLLRGAEMDDATERMHRALSKLDLTPGSGMVGIATFPEDGLGVKSLVEVASNAAGRAAVAGGPTVVRSDWFEGIQDRLDVFVVESDATLAQLLGQLVAKEGYLTDGVDTGSAALNLLIGPNAIAPPRLILLELDSMGTDGMMILRLLARAGTMQRSAVILTCSLINDAQLREAFDLGAVDVITKPFSTIVFRNRIARVLAP